MRRQQLQRVGRNAEHEVAMKGGHGDDGGPNVAEYSLASSGTLTSLGNTTAVSGEFAITDEALSNDGKYLYVLSPLESGSSTICRWQQPHRYIRRYRVTDAEVRGLDAERLGPEPQRAGSVVAGLQLKARTTQRPSAGPAGPPNTPPSTPTSGLGSGQRAPASRNSESSPEKSTNESPLPPSDSLRASPLSELTVERVYGAGCGPVCEARPDRAGPRH